MTIKKKEWLSEENKLGGKRNLRKRNEELERKLKNADMGSKYSTFKI